ncbi:MAG TPA: PP2C family protein-serine/threonine phosphatase [Streptosporangiaceae bacterium]|nr:PP2C family protein-serine/threonine phosphatase [Streptosporangiaceae bacterium]
MVEKVRRQFWAALRLAAARQRAMIRRQFITRNRRMALGLAIVVIGIGIGVVRAPGDWLSPGVMILPILAGGLLLWPRALRVLFVIVAAMLAYDWLYGKKAGLGIIATIVLTAAFAAVLARTRAKLGMQGLRGDQMLIELRDRLRAQSRMPQLPDSWRAVSVLRPAGGSSFGGDFLVSACDGKVLDLALVDVAGKGLDAGTRALMLSGAFGGLLGSVPHADYLPACNAYLQRGGPPEGFVTAVHLTLDLVTGDFQISSAGHPPAAHFESGNGRWRLTHARGIVLGVVPDLRCVPDRGNLRPGDALMLYSDGLVDAPGRDIDAGIDRLLGEADRLVANGFGEGAARLVQTMQGGGPNTDDCALALIWRS